MENWYNKILVLEKELMFELFLRSCYVLFKIIMLNLFYNIDFIVLKYWWNYVDFVCYCCFYIYFFREKIK